ncbi:MAG TPA: ABC transporter permease [Anaerolineae bacterium]
MLKNIADIAILHLKMTFRSRGVLVSQLLMPLLFTYIIGLATSGSGDDGPRIWPINVANGDSGTLAAALVERLQADPSLAVQLATAEAAVAGVEAEEAIAALITPADFSQTLLANRSANVAFYVDPGEAEAQLAAQSVMAAASQVTSSLSAANVAVRVYEDLGLFEAGIDRERFFDEALAAAQAAWETPPLLVESQPETRLESMVIPSGVNQSSPGMMVMFAMFLMLGGAAVLIQERRQGTLRRLLVMPIHRASLLLGKMLGIYATGIVQMAVLIVLGALLYGVEWGRSPVALALVVLSFGLAITGLGIMIAALARTYAQANALGTILVLAVASLGGAWWPLEIVPAWLQTIGRLTPVAWAMAGFHDIITRGLDVTAVLPEVGVLLAFAVIFLLIGLSRFSYE